MCRASLYRMFCNIRYAGKIPIPGTNELIDGRYPAMVTVDEYNRVQCILGKKGKPRLTPKRDFVYKGIFVCGECGSSVTAEVHTRGDHTYIYYHCTHKRKNYKCKQASIEEVELSRQIDEIFNGLSINETIQPPQCWLACIYNFSFYVYSDSRYRYDFLWYALRP